VVTGTSEARPPGAPEGAGYQCADLGDDGQLEELTALVARITPGILVNNAGINIRGDTPTFAMDAYERLQRVNVRGPFSLIQAALPGMRARSWGRIVNITSIWGVLGNAENAAYCASKFALDGLTASVAAEVAADNILVNAVAPGYVHTDAVAAGYTAEMLATARQAIPLGRLASPDEIAALVCWLASDENTYMTGQNLLIDGGLTRTAHP